MRKFLPYILIIIFALVGFFSPTAKVDAQNPPLGTCTIGATDDSTGSSVQGFPESTPNLSFTQCGAKPAKVEAEYAEEGFLVSAFFIDWKENQTEPPAPTSSGSVGEKPAGAPDETDSCSLNPFSKGSFSLSKCIAETWKNVTEFIYWLVGNILNILLYVALGGNIYNQGFISTAWGIVRDISNIFFILILLYIAIKIILDIGAAEAKKMIAWVIITAMLINFSMFFTLVIVDSSNILAMIFYNQIGTVMAGEKNPDYSGIGRDTTGALMKGINPSQLTPGGEIEGKANTALTIKGVLVAQANTALAGSFLALFLLLSQGILQVIAIIVFVIICFAFLNRIVTLMFLIIFSPFAFMSFNLPILKKMKYVGWDDWLGRLFKNAFFAPIFMFMLFLIFMLVKDGLVKNILHPEGAAVETFSGFIGSIFTLLFGFGLIMLLLWIAVKFAYTASGKAGEMVVKGAKVVGVAAMAAATGGASALATSAVGGAAARTLADTGLRATALGGGPGAAAAAAKIRRAERIATTPIDITSPMKTIKGLMGPTAPSISGGYKGMVKENVEGLKRELELYKRDESNEETEKRTTAEQADYDHDKNEAKKKTGYAVGSAQEKAWETDYEKKNGERPEIYKTTEGFNNATMKKFQANLGQHSNWGIEGAGREKFSKELQKGFDAMKKVEDRIAENTEILENIYGVLEEKGAGDYVSGNKKTGFIVNANKLNDAIEGLSFEMESSKITQKKLLEEGKGSSQAMNDLKKEFIDQMKEKRRLETIKGAPKEMKDLKEKIYNLGKDKSALAEKQKPKEKKEEKEHTETHTKTHTESHTETHTGTIPAGTIPPAGGGGGHH